MSQILHFDPQKKAIKSVDLTDPEAFRSMFGFDPEGNGRLSASIEQLYEREGFFKRCVKLRGRSAQSVPLSIIDEKGETVWSTSSRMPIPADLEWLNPTAYIGSVAAGIAMYGQHVSYIKGQFRETSDGIEWVGIDSAKYLSGRTTTPEMSPGRFGPDETGEFTHYRREIGGRLFHVNRIATIEAFDQDPTVEQGAGTPDSVAAQPYSQILMDIGGYTSEQLRNGLMKKVLLTADSDARLPDESVLKRMKDFASRVLYRPDRNQRMASDEIVFFQGVKPEIIGLSLAELDSDSLLESAKKLVANSFGIPLSVVLANAANYAAAVEHRIEFISSTVCADVDAGVNALNRVLNDLGYTIVSEPEKMDVFIERELGKADKVSKLADRPLISLSEGRDMLDMDTEEIGEGADEILPRKETASLVPPPEGIEAKSDPIFPVPNTTTMSEMHRSDRTEAKSDLVRWRKVAEKKGRYARFSPDHLTPYEIAAVFDSLANEAKSLEDVFSLDTLDEMI